jgi:phytoene dehydrogenase-like protein
MSVISRKLPSEVDGIFIGSGHNALVAANYLSRAGARTLVLESQSAIGGGLRTEELTLPLFKHNLGAFFVRWTPEYRIWQDLKLGEYGLQSIVPDIQMGLPLRDGAGLVTYRSIEQSVASISKFSQRDAQTYKQVYAEFGDLAKRIIDPLRHAPPIPDDELESLLKQSSMGRRYMEIAAYTPLDLVRELFEHEVVRTLLLFNIATRAYLPLLNTPGTGHIAIVALLASHGAAMVRGGTHRIAHALASSLFNHGGIIITDAKVEQILVEQGRAVGVELSNGQRVFSRHFVCSSLPATVTLGRLVNDSYLDSDLRERLRNYHWNEDSLFGVHLALREPPQYRNVDAGSDLNRAFNYCVGYESSSDLELEMYRILEAAQTDTAAFQAGVPSLFDSSQSPPGYSTAFAWKFVPSRSANGGAVGWTGEEEEKLAGRMLALWQQYSPNLREAEIAHAVLSPLDTERFIPSMILGDRHHGSYHPDNFYANRPEPGLSHYGTPIQGLYHCGSATHPGGSITGQPGYNAASVIANNFGYNLWWRPSSPREALLSL